MVDTTQIFSTLKQLYLPTVIPREAYTVLSPIFSLIADEFTRDAGISFTGLLPRVDYLIKKYPSESGYNNLSMRVHNLRYRLSRIDMIPDENLATTLASDIATVARWLSRLTDTDIPTDLRELFPLVPLHTATPRERHDNCCRIIVDRIDDSFIYSRADSEDMPEIKVAISHGEHDFSHLTSIVEPGTQLNIVGWTRNGNKEYLPQLIIFEPDYLTDISGIAECFETYATSPIVSLIKKIQPEQVSRSILLGGFAGQLLDEAIHRKNGEAFDYKKAINSFFRESALKMAACTDLDSTFHTDAKAQQKNIETVIREILPQLNGYDPDKIIVEPSFFCETLGVQGRMDMLQTDFSILVEQKSGKGRFGSDEHGTPLHQEKHLVQLLLYQAVLHYGMNIPSSAINSFLLYSKYPRPLVKPGNAPKLLEKAIELRNLIVANEIRRAGSGGFDILDSITPDSLNENGITGKLWDKYVKPQLSSIIEPYSKATPLEKGYIKRLLEFISAEHLNAKTGFNAVTSSSGFSGAWLTPLSEKKSMGNICDSLAIGSLETDTYGNVERVIVEACDESSLETANFRAGDIVILYSYPKNGEPDIRRSITIRASVESIGNSSITLLLRAPQSNPNLFTRSMAWAIEHDLLDSSFRSQYRAVYSMLSAPRHRRELILQQRRPETEAPRELAGDYGNFNDMVAKSRAARDIFAIIGPPGTGKTSFGMLNILREELTDADSSVIITAYTNRAVDEICSKLSESGIEYTRVGSSLGCNPAFRSHLLSAQTDQCQTVGEIRSLLTSVRVVVGTLQAIASASTMFRFRKFSLAIVDEASQILEPQMLSLLCAITPEGEAAIRRFVLIGDHKQLPAVVCQPAEKSVVTDESLREIGLTDCRRSFFERFLESAYDNNRHIYDPELVYSFSRQGRMHADISDIASKIFYNNQLNIVPLPHQTEPITQADTRGPFGSLLNGQRVTFIDTELPVNRYTGNSNDKEASVIADVVREIIHREGDNFDPATTIGIIVPYRTQISAVKNAMSRIGDDRLNRISIDTVERFQGSQRNYIIYGFTVTQPHQLRFLTSTRFIENGNIIDRKLNVALTRARSHMILIGNRRLLSSDPLFDKVIQLCEKPIINN